MIRLDFPVFIHTCQVASLIATMTDLLMIPYPLWNYPSQTSRNLFFKQMIHTFTVYPVVVYLFLQTLPRKQTFITVARHIFCWTIPCILLEWISLKINYIQHGLWWNLGYSYFADWVFIYLVLHVSQVGNEAYKAQHGLIPIPPLFVQ